MHFGAGDATRYFEAFRSSAPDLQGREVLFFVPAPLLCESVAALRPTVIAVGAQNIHWEERGPYTGEVSAEMVASTGAGYCLVGHSERRLLFGEDDPAAARKLKAALRHRLKPLLCVGERLDERRAGGAEARVVAQLERALQELNAAEIGRVAVAYEPVWAIGTGETATPEIATAMHRVVRDTLGRLAGPQVAAGVRILYGGSVTPANIDRLMAEPEIDGVLVGGASLDPMSFRRIVAFETAVPPV
jgi:triosephosphate isomerase